MINALRVSVAAAALVCSAGSLAQVHSLTDDAVAFGARVGVGELSISPDARHAVYIAPAKDRWSAVMVVDLGTGETKPIIVSKADPEILRWCNFATNDRLICRFTATVSDTGVLIGYSRLASLNLDGTDVKELGQRSSFYDAGLRQFDGSVLDWRPAQNGAVMMERAYVPEINRTNTRIANRQDGLGVDLIDVRTLKTTPIEPPKPGVAGFITDGLGNVRIMSMAQGESSTNLKHFYRAAGSREWQSLTGYVDPDDYRPLAVDATTNSAYVLKKLNGRMALYRVKLDGSNAEQLIASNAKVDIDNVVRVGDGLKVIGYTFAEDRRRAIYFDPEFENLAHALARTLPKSPAVSFVGSSADGQKLLIFAGSDQDPGRYYLFNKQTHELNELLETRPALDNRPLATVRSVTYSASDGVSVPAYLTLPPGKDAKGLPAVVLPHGGPSARDEWGFDWLSQFLAARGYAVIQPNYRGSAGFGDQWLMENGFKSWRTSIGDISAAAKYLASSGIADPNRIAIVGWSYGGYAALQSAATQPGLYKSVVAIAPVTDLQLLKSEAQEYTDGDRVAAFVGDGPQVIEGSPLRHAKDIAVPVLLVHADKDTNVAIEESDKMESALKGAGKDVEYLRITGLDHQLEDGVQRAFVLSHIGSLLDRTIGH